MQKSDIKIGFVTSDDPRNRRAWSGTLYRMLTAMEKQFATVDVLGPIPFSKYYSLVLRLKNIQHKILYGKKFDRPHSKIRSKYYAKKVKQKITGKDYDILFAPAGSSKTAYLETNIPICHLSDTSYNQIKNYYNSFSNISSKSIEEANYIEQRALDNAAIQVFSSDWAAGYAKSYYKARNTKVVKFGANIDAPPSKNEIVKEYSGEIKLLFLGVDWKRKGGDIVLETIDILSQKYDNFHLTVCGCVPPKKHPKMTVIPFLDKNKEEDRAKFHQLLCDSHILFVPTRAEAYGIVFCEASAYGLTVVTTATGGVTSIIKDDINGYCLPQEAKPEEYAKKISTLFDNLDTLKRLSISSRDRYDTELNWDVWAIKMRELFSNTLKK